MGHRFTPATIPLGQYPGPWSAMKDAFVTLGAMMGAFIALATRFECTMGHTSPGR